MLRLNLLRHAKSSWQAPDLDDHERDLRARRTLEGLVEGWPQLAQQAQVVDEALYTFDWEELLDWVQAFDGGSHSCFIIGHNPALTNLCNQLVGRPALDNLPTAGYLAFELPVERWSDVTEGIGSLEDWLFPRDLLA